MSDNPLAYEDAKSKGILWGFGSLLGVVLIVMLVLGEWWSREPEQFSVQDEAVERMNVTHTDQMPIGYVYANTLAHIADVILFKHGGYLSNDVAPPGLFCDNIQNFEYGALVMLRDATTALRNHFARDQSQSAEDPDLAKAEPYFYYERNSWALPSTESEYIKGVDALHAYMGRLQNPTSDSKPAQFHSRADNLWQYTEVVISVWAVSLPGLRPVPINFPVPPTAILPIRWTSTCRPSAKHPGWKSITYSTKPAAPLGPWYIF